MRHELQRRLDEAVAKLDEPDREVILMRHVEQLSNQDVATALGLSEDQVQLTSSKSRHGIAELGQTILATVGGDP